MLNAQTQDSSKVLKPTIALKDGATLFSADESFNGQVSTNKIIHEKADIAYQKNPKGTRGLEMTTPKPGSKTMSKSSDTLVSDRKKAIKPTPKNKKKVS